MIITRTSPYTHTTRSMELPITQEQLDEYNLGDKPIQMVFLNLTDSQREFLMTGITDEEWNEIFSDQEPY